MFEYFYHQRLRKSVAIFGTLFNNMYVIRKDASGKTISQVKVPLSYAPRAKYLERIRENADLNNDTKIAIKLPRMSFEIIALTYDGERKLPKLNAYQKGIDNTSRSKFFTPAPYAISFQLNIYAKSQDDALQLVEQILPYFNPQYTMTIKPFTENETIKEDVPITLQSVSFSDDYDGTLEARRTIVYTLDFLMGINFYGPINGYGIIRTVDTTLHSAVDFNASTDPKLQQVTVTPDPIDANPDDDYGFNTDVLEIFDSSI
jgi:hypothetical protein